MNEFGFYASPPSPIMNKLRRCFCLVASNIHTYIVKQSTAQKCCSIKESSNCTQPTTPHGMDVLCWCLFVWNCFVLVLQTNCLELQQSCCCCCCLCFCSQSNVDLTSIVCCPIVVTYFLLLLLRLPRLPVALRYCCLPSFNHSNDHRLHLDCQFNLCIMPWGRTMLHVRKSIENCFCVIVYALF